MSLQQTSPVALDVREVDSLAASLERKQFVEHVLGLLANHTRRSLLALLTPPTNSTPSPLERRAGEIAYLLGISASATSEHLRLLTQAGLVASRHEGTCVYYRLHNQPVMKAFHALLVAVETEYATCYHIEAIMPSPSQQVQETLMQTVTIRPAALADAEALVSLMRQRGSPTTAVERRQRLETLLCLNHYHTLVAVDKEQLVGMIGMCLVWHYETGLPSGQILAFVVAPTYRDSQIGTRLVTEAEHWFRDCGTERIVVSQRTTRSVTHRFYERLGYHIAEGHVTKMMEQGTKDISTGQGY